MAVSIREVASRLNGLRTTCTTPIFRSFIQSADIWGMLGLTWIMLLGNSVVYETIAWRFRKKRKFPTLAWIVFAVVMIANLGYGLGSVASIDDTVAASRASSR